MHNRIPRKSYRFSESLKCAIQGLLHTCITQSNFRFHLVASVLACAAGWWLEISRMEWLVLVVTIGLVIMAELFNTAVEVLTNIVSPEYNKQAGVVKDVAAAAVLITAVISLVAGCIIFLPKFF